jgi:hypothetical protein
MNPLATYFQDLHDIYVSGAGVPETSGYGPLANLFNEVGKSLKPRVRCIINIANKGAGIPDGGFFTPDQFQKRSKGQLIEGQLPSRGAVEVKPTSNDIDAIAGSEQVRRYVNRYQQVLVTNYRDFVLVGLNGSGSLVKRERFMLASNETEFWKAASNSRATPTELGERFIEYLKRVMLHAAPLTQPKDVAWFLASYARDAKIRVESTELPALAAIRNALEEALGLRFEDEKGEHFFRSTLVQTLFYGIFSAWVLWSKKNRKRTDKFDWRNATWELHVPMIKALFEQIATPTKLQAADLVEVLNWTGDVLNRVEREVFFANFEESHAVQYFYEPFLQAFDPELRKELGVWFTPTEIVKYMVARVDTVLREELNIADGLADPRVYVLDPACGTGAYLVEVLHKIHETLKAKGEDALAANDLKRAAMNRVFGFEILPAPFVVSHLQLGLLLQNLGAPLAEMMDERVGVYLTNALTGWEPPSEEVKNRLDQLAFTFAELKQEHDAAERVKRAVPILVILGNPPYNGFAGVAIEEERDLSDAYRTTINAPPPSGQGLNDLYVRFFRMADRRIADIAHQGIVCFISNYSWLDGASFTGMRERYMTVFSDIWIDNLHGDRIISEYSPDGRTSETVFALDTSSPGIKVGTSITLLVLAEQKAENASIHYRDMNEARASKRRLALLASLNWEEFGAQYASVTPNIQIGLPFKPRLTSTSYFNWPLLPEILPISFPGVKTSRDSFLVDVDRERLYRRLKLYFDPNTTDEMLRRVAPTAMNSTARYDAASVRDYLGKRGLRTENIVRYYYRPFDTRWLYWEAETKLLDEKRPEYFPQIVSRNVWLSAGQRNRMESFYQPQFTRVLADHHIVESNVGMFPLYLRARTQQTSFLEQHVAADELLPNLAVQSSKYVHGLNVDPAELFYHVLAVLHSRHYREENSGALRQDWPRIPLSATKEILLHSAELGRKIAALLDTEAGVDGVTMGEVANSFRVIGRISHISGKPLNPAEDLKLTIGWGHAGKGGVTMPGRGKIFLRDYSPEERKAIGRGAEAAGLSTEVAFAQLGERTYDVYLNDIAYWKNIPTHVWDYTIGGYQVIKKWLSYRELELLGRPLTPEEAREVMNIARRIAAIVLMEPALDHNYQAVKSVTYDWPEK